MSLIKAPEQIKTMREAGLILSGIMVEIASLITPGVKTLGLEERFMFLCGKYGVFPACKGYTAEGYLPPFPTGLCVSVNNQSVHCYPTKDRTLVTGDIITVDTVIKYKGLHADCAFAKAVGRISQRNQQLLDASKSALLHCEKLVKPGVKIGFIAHNMEELVKAGGFNVLRDYAGHGIGTQMHEYPEIPCYADSSEGPVLKTGMTICVESLVCEGNPKVDVVDDWATQMHDGKNFAQFEHTILVTADGYEVLTPFEV